MEATDRLARRFDEHRPHLLAVSYRMLGSLSDAEDATQNAWLRLSQADAHDIENLGGWLTRVVGRECLHILRTRRRRPEVSAGDLISGLPDPIVSAAAATDDPEQRALRKDAVSLALLAVLDSLRPTERLSFVLHDMFDVRYDEIARLADCSPAAARQLASRARRRIREEALPVPDSDHRRERAVVDAFYAAADSGDFAALVGILDPDVTFRADFGPSRAAAVYHGSKRVARLSLAGRGARRDPVLVNGLPGVIAAREGLAVALLAFTVRNGRIVAIDGIRDPARVQRLLARIAPLPGVR